jgi:cytochrome c2
VSARALSAALGAGLGLAALATASAAMTEATPDAGRGRAVFASKQCGRCHGPREQSGIGPALEDLRRPQGAFELAGRLWNHAPAMFMAVKGEGIEWPRISETEMRDLVAYLQADPARDSAPDLFKGETTLVHKGCLKCHSLRREGGRIGPDLAERGADYSSAVVWATKMWVHTPRMADKARQLGVLYPRFSGAEMGDLIGFLKTVAK